MVLVWWPTSCTLQLNLSKSSADGVLRAGIVYGGTSTIRYVKREPAWTSPPEATAPTSASTTSSPLSAYDQFLDTVSTTSGPDGRGGLPLHAYTAKSSRYPAVVPLQVLGYKVSAVAGGSPLKLLSVVELDATTKPDAHPSSTGAKGKSKQAATSGGRRKVADTEATATDAGHTHATEHDDDDAVNVIGAKWVRFQGADTLPVGTEVELAVTFNGTIQESDQGGLYAGPGSGADGQAVLTHFEVSLARFAFPCPDHPQYRLDWQLKTLQLPQTYTQVITNGTELTRKVLPAQGAIQYSYSACGPMPVYVFAFACFRTTSTSETATPLLCAEGVVPIHSARAYMDADAGGVDGDGAAQLIPLRVLATPQSGISMSVLDQALKTAQEAIRLLQDFFQCPLPLLQCDHMDILLAPTMPYISGMEHHGCIFLNESIFQSKGKKPTGSAALEEQTALIVHELAHHWIGNALGLPFSAKEGVCQLLEQCLGDVIGGRPMRKYHHTVDGADPSTQPQETVQGKEFTGHTYQHALLALQRLVGTAGFAAFEAHARALVRCHLLEPMGEVEDYGGVETVRLASPPEAWPFSPYLSTTEAMQALHGTT